MTIQSRSFHKYVLFSIVLLGVSLLAALVFAGWGSVLDKVGKKAKEGAKEMNINFTPEQERYIGRTVAANVIAQYGLDKNSDVKKYVNLVGLWVANFSARPELPYHFEILDSDEVNAFSAPGGFIFISRGMLSAMKDEAQLAGVLAHEVSHVALNHGLNLIKDEYRKKYLMKTGVEEGAQFAGASPELVERFTAVTDKLTETLLVNGYSRDLEYQADKAGTQYALEAGYRPNGIRSFLEVLAASGSAEGGKLAKMSKTHPSLQDRIKKLDGEFGDTLEKDGKGLDQRFQEKIAAMHR